MTHKRPPAYSYIRFSSPEQARGDSYRRQAERAQKWADKNGYEIVDTLADLGVSASRGKNYKQGALGEFVKLVREGKIPAGGVLIVEDLDRMSRDKPRKALQLFLELIDEGLGIVTLTDEQLYTAKSLDDDPYGMKLFGSIMVMVRAHNEVARKGELIGDRWANKRTNKRADGTFVPLTARCKPWLRLVTPEHLKGESRRRQLEGSEFQKIAESVKTVQWIYDQAAANIGIYTITKRLNEQLKQKRRKLITKANGWHASYVAKLLSDRAVIGEYQPCKRLADGKRIAVGQPIANYYPRIIDKELFYRVQGYKAGRQIHARGRKGKNFTNLFSGFATCHYCNARMILINKGPQPKGGLFLVCEASQRYLGCGIRKGWKYEHFEASFLAFVEKVDLAAIINDDSSEKRELDDRKDYLEGRRIDLEQRNQTLQEAMHEAKKQGREEIPQFVRSIGENNDELKAIETQLEEVRAKRQALDAHQIAFYESKYEIVDLIGQLHAENGGDLYNLRAQVSARIRALIETLEIASAGFEPVMDRMIGDPPNDPEYLRKPWFKVVFKDQSTQWGMPNKDDPLTIDTWHESEVIRSINLEPAALPQNHKTKSRQARGEQAAS